MRIPFLDLTNDVVLETFEYGDRVYYKDSEEYTPGNNYMITEVLNRGFKLMNPFGHTLSVTFNQLRKENWLVSKLPFWLRKNVGYQI
jgi:hypothetical protein